jgi:hypothetical protein
MRKDIRKRQANRDTTCQKGKARHEGLHAGVAALTSDASDQTAAVQPIFAQKSGDRRLARPFQLYLRDNHAKINHHEFPSFIHRNINLANCQIRKNRLNHLDLCPVIHPTINQKRDLCSSQKKINHS